jgi:hypothetical protein
MRQLALAALLAWMAVSGPLEPARGADGDAVAAVLAGRDYTETRRAFLRVPDSRKTAAIHEAYVLRMVQLGRTHDVALRAQIVVNRDANSAIGWAVLAWSAAQRNNMPQAAEDLLRPAGSACTEPMAVQLAARLIAWHETAEVPDLLSRKIAPRFAKLRQRYDDVPGFDKALRQARIEARNQPGDSAARTAARRKPSAARPAASARPAARRASRATARKNTRSLGGEGFVPSSDIIDPDDLFPSQPDSAPPPSSDSEDRAALSVAISESVASLAQSNMTFAAGGGSIRIGTSQAAVVGIEVEDRLGEIAIRPIVREIFTGTVFGTGATVSHDGRLVTLSSVRLSSASNLTFLRVPVPGNPNNTIAAFTGPGALQPVRLSQAVLVNQPLGRANLAQPQLTRQRLVDPTENLVNDPTPKPRLTNQPLIPPRLLRGRPRLRGSGELPPRRTVRPPRSGGQNGASRIRRRITSNKPKRKTATNQQPGRGRFATNGNRKLRDKLAGSNGR